MLFGTSIYNIWLWLNHINSPFGENQNLKNLQKMVFSAHFGQPEMCDNSKYDVLWLIRWGGGGEEARFNHY